MLRSDYLIKGGSTSNNLPQDGDMISTILNVLLTIDILQFAGLSYFIMSLLSKYKISVQYIILLILVISIISPYLWGLQTGNIVFDRFLDLLWGNKGDLVSFPLFAWLVYPLGGYVMGHYLLHIDYKKVLQKAFYIGLISLIIGSIVTYTNPKFHLGDYWHTGIGGLLIYTGFVLMWMKVCDLVVHTFSEKLYAKIAFISKNLTNFYALQWIFIVSLIPFLGQKESGYEILTILMVTIFFATYFSTQKMEQKNINF